jgi:hypothetical protein
MDNTFINLNEIDAEPIEINLGGTNSKPTVNFGDGIELLMNDKKRTSSSDKLNIDIGDLDNLEKELNHLSTPAHQHSDEGIKSLSGLTGDLFGLGGFSKVEDEIKLETEKINIDIEPIDSNLGSATRDSIGVTKTWDGFTKMNEVPQAPPPVNNMSDRERRRKKRIMLKKMEEWSDKGHFKMNNLSMDSSFEEIEDEYETILDEKRKKDSIKLQGWWFMTFVNSIEYANAAFNPFDLNLDGWGEQISEDIDSYDEIFGELHEKYKGGKMAPELSLLLRVGFSAAVLNFSNKALSSATPAFNDVIKQNPDLMRMFTDATVDTMSQQSPGFGFANNIVQEQMNKPRGPPPPAPVETKSQPPPSRPGMTFTETPSNRPDINAGRGAMFREQGVEINKNASSVNEAQTKSIRPRAEMKGPQNSDIDDILSGLKTRNVDIQKQNSQESKNNESLVSVSSLRDLDNANVPSKSNKRRNRSDKNVISLDI